MRSSLALALLLAACSGAPDRAADDAPREDAALNAAAAKLDTPPATGDSVADGTADRQ